MSRIAVFLRVQNPMTDVPAHHAGKDLVICLEQAHLVRFPFKDRRAVHLLTSDTWAEVKRRFCKPLMQREIPSLRPPQRVEPCLMLSYPPAPRGTLGRQRQAEIWLRADRF